MKLGFGLYRTMLNSANLRFAQQAGATHIVAHMPGDVSDRNAELLAAYGERAGHGLAAGPDDPLWTYEGLRDLKAMVNAEGLELEALENFAPAHWYDILLDGPRKAAADRAPQDASSATWAGPASPSWATTSAWPASGATSEGPLARGGAVSVGFDEPAADAHPQRHGLEHGLRPGRFDPDSPERVLAPVSDEEIRGRFGEFLDEMVPVAEEAGVRLAAAPRRPAHALAARRAPPGRISPDALRSSILDLNPSPANALEFCLGTLAEMPGGDIYDTRRPLSAAPAASATSTSATCAAKCRTTTKCSSTRATPT